MTGLDLLPTKASFSPDEAVIIDVRGGGAGEFVVWHLGDAVARVAYGGDGRADLGTLPPGGYGIELTTGSSSARTAVEVATGFPSRLRYGFVVDFSPDRDVSGVVDTVRRLHLTGVLFYDWAYRHALLLGGGEEYRDPLGQPISLTTVRRLVAAVQNAGASALGYAAVYAVGGDEWPRWCDHALLRPTGVPYALGDFLNLIDPAAEDWLAHFTGELEQATVSVGFDGFHLDQYGYPKLAVDPEGNRVDVADSFVRMIAATRSRLPAARLVFNNVNDFPTWATASAPQDAIYIEVWPPHVTLGSLADVVRRARAADDRKPIVIAAYQHVYATEDAASADRATAFTMATLYSHGATQLLAGEANRVLVDPYYVRNHVVEPSTGRLLTRWYDFAVEHDELLFDPKIVEVTGALTGSYNGDCDVEFAGAPTSETAEAGTVWRRVMAVGDRLIVHLINLVGQRDVLWDTAREPIGRPGVAVLRVRRVGRHVPRIRVADPDRFPRLVEVPSSVDGDFATAELPEFGVWQLLIIDLVPEMAA